MKDKKSPERFSIRFDTSLPEHQQVIEILSKKGRNAARYIADAILSYEAKDKSSIESTVTEVVSQMLKLNKPQPEPKASPYNVADDFDADEISAELAKFRQ